MEIEIPAFENGGWIPRKFAMGIPDGEGRAKFGKNINPEIRWDYTHEDALSFVLICVDPTAPTDPSTVNKAGVTVPEDQPRADFYHWVLIDIHPQRSVIREGEVSDAVKAGGKKFGLSGLGMMGVNSFTDWFAGDPELEGQYGSYDGPFPPWNDELVHEYHFKLFSLDVSSLELSGPFTGEDVLAAMDGHILEEAVWVGKYSLNKAIIG